MRLRTDQTRRAEAFKDAALTTRMADEVRKRARAAYKAGQARGAGPDEMRVLEVQVRITHARAAAAVTLEDDAWSHFRDSLPHG